MVATMQDLYKFAAQLERMGEKIFEHARIWNIEPAPVSADPRVMAVLLLVRTLSNFRGALLLLRADRIVEARTLVRCCFENLFTIAAIRTEGFAFVKEMAEDHKASRKARGENLLQHTADMPERAWRAKLQLFLDSLGKNQSRRRSLDPKSVAARGPLRKGYVYYAELSADSAHPTLDSLQRYLGRNIEDATPIRTIDLNPIVKPEERRMALLMACEALLGVFVAATEILQHLDLNKELGALAEEYQSTFGG
jgi:hypothetical protein